MCTSPRKIFKQKKKTLKSLEKKKYQYKGEQTHITKYQDYIIGSKNYGAFKRDELLLLRIYYLSLSLLRSSHISLVF